MPAIKLENFMGMIPRVSARLLPNSAATTASNTKLLSGEARGFRAPREVVDLSDNNFTVRRAFRIPKANDYYYGSDEWLAFDRREVDIIRSPIINDLHNRYYWAGDGRPKYNTLQRIVSNVPELYLGVPAPATQPTVTPPDAGTATTRSYVVTFVSDFGEEGPNSEPTPVQTAATGTWVISNLPTSVPDASHRLITKKRIYRTVPGNSSSSFFFVAEVPIATTTYNDTLSDDDAALNSLLESTTWQPPPADMEGFVVMPNGFLVGWVGRRLLFSEPYRPHAWPVEYELSTEFEIVGLAVVGSTLIIGTESNPYIGAGVTPSSFTVQKLDAIMPCLSRRGIVSTPNGVYYPTVNGLAFTNGGTPQIVTQPLMTKEEWLNRYSPDTIFAATYGMQYIAFTGPSFGFIFDPTEPTARLVEIDRFNDVEGIETDRYNGDVYLIYNDRVWEWDPKSSERLYWRWKSKQFHLPSPVNFGALKIKFDDAPDNVEDDILDYYLPYNQARFNAARLNTLNGHVLHGVEKKGLVPSWTEPENRMPLGGSPLYPINFMLLQTSAVRFTMYANDEIVFDTIVTTQDMVRLPTGFKRDVYQFEMVSNTNVYSVSIAGTGKELGAI
jgi:hypothetical protein